MNPPEQLCVIKMFARARDLAEADTISVTLALGATVADLRSALARRVPALTDLLSRSAIAINGEFAVEEQRIPAQAELAVLPPVSGG